MFEVEVGPKVINCDIVLKVELKSMDKKKVQLQDSFRISFDLLRGRSVLAAQFLRRNQDGYYI